jgi:hypothetical protein
MMICCKWVINRLEVSVDWTRMARNGDVKVPYELDLHSATGTGCCIPYEHGSELPDYLK